MKGCKPHKGVRFPIKCDVINDSKLFPTVYRKIRILLQIFDTFQSDVALQNHEH